MESAGKKAKTTTQMPAEEDGRVPSSILSTDIIDKAIQDYFGQAISAAISKDDYAKPAKERQDDVDVAMTVCAPTSSNALTMERAWHQSTGGKDNNK